MNEIPGVGKVKWAYEKPVVVQIKETIYGLRDAIVWNEIL